MELLLEPQILLLDEPTTGLDSFSANEIVNCLTKVANENGRTIIMSLHQPRYAIFKKLDNLTLLTVDGRLAYHGMASNARSYFENRGNDVKFPFADTFAIICYHCEARRIYIVFDMVFTTRR